MEQIFMPFLKNFLDPSLFIYMNVPPILVTALACREIRKKKRGPVTFKRGLQIWSKITLETSLMLGIMACMVAVQGITAWSGPVTEGVYSSVIIALTTFAWGGILTGVAFSVVNNSNCEKPQISALGVTITIVIIAYFQMQQIFSTGSSPKIFFLNPFAWSVYGTIFIICFILNLAARSRKRKLSLLTEANVAATLGGAAIGICLWFTEGDDYNSSREAIFLTANIMFLGCWNYLLSYFFSLTTSIGVVENLRIKTWHFAEAASFFTFLIYAPIGATEFFREGVDNAAIQTQHEAQEIRIEQLEAQIRLLTANQKS